MKDVLKELYELLNDYGVTDYIALVGDINRKLVMLQPFLTDMVLLNTLFNSVEGFAMNVTIKRQSAREIIFNMGRLSTLTEMVIISLDGDKNENN